MSESSEVGVDRFAQSLGVEVMCRSFDQAICRIMVGAEQRNALGGIHGGLIFSLADMAFAAACNAGDGVFIGMQAEIRYMAGARGEALTATATRVGGSKKFAHYEVWVTDGSDHRIALFTSTAYKLSD